MAGLGLTDGTGNALGNVIRGNAADNLLRVLDGMDTLDGKAGADVIEGGLGNDKLTGGTEADAFVFNCKPNSISDMDTVTDFVSGTDKLVFDKTTYTAFTAVGAIGSAAFWSGAGVNAAHDATDRFIYNTTTGALWYDADGTGSAAVGQMAALTGRPALAFGDILIVAWAMTHVTASLAVSISSYSLPTSPKRSRTRSVRKPRRWMSCASVCSPSTRT